MRRLAESDQALVGKRGAAVFAVCGAFCMLAVVACGGESSSATTWDGAVRDSAGVEIVENFGAPLWPGGPDWRFTQELRIGVIEGAPEYQFGDITGLQVLSDGRIVIADAHTLNVRFYTPEGFHIRTVMREGQGLGELGSGGHAVHLGPGDTLIVMDRGNSRVHTLAPDGTWLGTFSLLPKDGYDGGYWATGVGTGRLTSLHGPTLQSDGTRTDSLSFVLERDVHGGIVDTLAWLPSRYTFYRGEPGIFRYYYSPAWWHRAWGEGHMISRMDEYRFWLYGPNGTLQRIVSLAREPLPITDEDRAAFMERWDDYLRENSVPADRWAEIKARIGFSDNYPAYIWFDNGPAGTLLVQRVKPTRDLNAQELKDLNVNQVYYPPNSPKWDVFDREGRYLGAVVIPGSDKSRALRFFHDDVSGAWYMYTIWSDEVDVQYIVRWRINGRMPA